MRPAPDELHQKRSSNNLLPASRTWLFCDSSDS